MIDEAIKWARWSVCETYPRRNYSPTSRFRAAEDIRWLRWLLMAKKDGLPCFGTGRPAIVPRLLRKA